MLAVAGFPPHEIDCSENADFPRTYDSSTMLPALHRKIEECSFKALPAEQTEHFDGWLIRMTAHGPKRANSVNVLSESALPLGQKIDYCKNLFTQKQLPLIYRLTDHAWNAELDACLQRDGLQKIDESIVMTCDLSRLAPFASPSYQELDTDEWIAQLMALDPAPQARKLAHAGLLRMLTLPVIYGAARMDGTCAAIGLAVVDGDHAGLFDIMTDAGLRGNGYARLLTSGLLQRAKEHGAKAAYLQVVADNLPARSLYESLGFQACYRYWYRVQRDA